MKQVKVNEDVFDALLSLAEAAIANDVADKSEIDALKKANENEEELEGARADRVAALLPPAAPAPEQPAVQPEATAATSGPQAIPPGA